MKSLGRIAAITGNTLTELTRQKAFHFLLLFALLLIGSSAVAARLTLQQELQVLKDIALGAISIFTSLLAIIATARLLPQEVEEGTVHTILAKPVYRIEYLLGKLAGVFLLLFIATAVMTMLFVVVLQLRQHAVISETVRQMAGAPRDQADAALAGAGAAGFNINLLEAILLLLVQAWVLAAMTLFISSFATSTLYTIVTVVFVYLIGHLQGTVREYWLESNSTGPLAQLFLAVVALCFPDLQLFNPADDVAAGALLPLALLGRTAGLGVFYITVCLLLTWIAFERKEL